jgi:hypothetical protein
MHVLAHEVGLRVNLTRVGRRAYDKLASSKSDGGWPENIIVVQHIRFTIYSPVQPTPQYTRLCYPLKMSYPAHDSLSFFAPAVNNDFNDFSIAEALGPVAQHAYEAPITHGAISGSDYDEWSATFDNAQTQYSVSSSANVRPTL